MKTKVTTSICEALEQMLRADAGAIERCDQMYASQWRSAPFPASSLDSESFAAFDADLRFEVAAAQAGPRPDDNDEWAQEGWYERVGEVESMLPAMLHQNSLVVSLMTYKGEELGLALFDEKTKELPEFISKDFSAAYFNA